MEEKRYRERLNALFEHVERLNASPASQTAEVRAELAALQTRLQQLEAEIEALECNEASKGVQAIAGQPASVTDISVPSVPLLQEQERFGFADTENELKPIPGPVQVESGSPELIDPSPVLSGTAIGEVKVDLPDEKQPTGQEVNAAGAVAERSARQHTHSGWESYMDAIHQSERIGYAYDQSGVVPYVEPATPEDGFQQSVSVMDEQVGTLYLKPDPSRPFTEVDLNMVRQVAQQVAQQVENIRLLADAARARSEAEDATRRLTRENWQAYAERHEGEALAFAYDTVNVLPLQDESLVKDVVIEEQLVVRGESIGQLKVAGLKDVNREAIETANAIAKQASLHLETLRLTEELQKRAYELQELDRIKSAFLANMSHELRTPLNSILGFADVMLEEIDGPLTEYMHNDLRLIQKNGQHLLHLINDVLDMAKIEAGRMNLHPEKFRVYEMFEEVTAITSSLASDKNLALVIDDLADQEVEVFADRTRIRQVMINLVNNSIKFTENGKVVVKVKPMEGARVLITVKDTGIGIPPDNLESVFLEFTQVDTSTTRKVGGTGLGLPISRRLVEMHGGRLWAESTGINGEGSTFVVELPVEARITDVIEKQAK